MLLLLYVSQRACCWNCCEDRNVPSAHSGRWIFILHHRPVRFLLLAFEKPETVPAWLNVLDVWLMHNHILRRFRQTGKWSMDSYRQMYFFKQRLINAAWSHHCWHSRRWRNMFLCRHQNFPFETFIRFCPMTFPGVQVNPSPVTTFLLILPSLQVQSWR